MGRNWKEICRLKRPDEQTAFQLRMKLATTQPNQLEYGSIRDEFPEIFNNLDEERRISLTRLLSEAEEDPLWTKQGLAHTAIEKTLGHRNVPFGRFALSEATFNEKSRSLYHGTLPSELLAENPLTLGSVFTLDEITYVVVFKNPFEILVAPATRIEADTSFSSLSL